MNFKHIKKKFWRNFIILMSVIAAITSSTFAVSAAIDYDDLPYGIVKRIERANFFTDKIRAVEYSIICVLGKFCDEVKSAVDTIMDFNLYKQLTKRISLDIDNSIMEIAWAVLTLALIFAAILLMVNHDKFKMSDFVRSFLISTCLIIALPSLVSQLEKMKDKGLGFVEAIEDTKDSQELSLGENIVGSNVVVIDIDYNSNSYKSLKNEDKIIYYSKYYEKYAKSGNKVSPYYLNINQYANKNVFDRYVTSASAPVKGKEKTVDDINVPQMFELLGYSKEYETYLELGSKSLNVFDNTLRPTDSYTRPNSGGSNMHTYDSNQYLAYLVRLVAQNSNVLKHNGLYGAIRGDAKNFIEWYGDGTVNVKIRKYDEQQLASVVLGNTLWYLKTNGVIDELLSKESQDNYSELAIGQYATTKLKSSSDYEEMGTLEKYVGHIGDLFLYGEDEHIYSYSIDFVPALITLVTLIICLVFAGFKLAALLYDIVFMQIIAPIVIATDLHGAGRAKKIILEMLNVYLIFIIVMLDFKIYLLILNWILPSSYSLIVKLFIVLGGMKFCIDGPDIVTKLLGIDAGVKSGYGTIMGLQAAGRMVSGATRTVSNTAHRAANMGKPIVGGVVGGVAGGVGGTVSGAVNAAKTAHQNGAGVARSTLNGVGGAVAGGISGTASGVSTGAKGQGITHSAQSGVNIGGKTGHIAGNSISNSAKSAGNSISERATGAWKSITSHSNADIDNGNSSSAVNGTQNNSSEESSSSGTYSGGNNDNTSTSTATYSEGSSVAPFIIQGGKGDKGDKGDRGDNGLQGERGIDGDKGTDGQQGEQGQDGSNGVSLSPISSSKSSTNKNNGGRAGGAFNGTSANIRSASGSHTTNAPVSSGAASSKSTGSVINSKGGSSTSSTPVNTSSGLSDTIDYSYQGSGSDSYSGGYSTSTAESPIVSEGTTYLNDEPVHESGGIEYSSEVSAPVVNTGSSSAYDNPKDVSPTSLSISADISRQSMLNDIPIHESGSGSSMKQSELKTERRSPIKQVLNGDTRKKTKKKNK